MVNSVQHFIGPNQHSYYAGQSVAQQLAQALDTNNDGNLEPTELELNDSFKSRLDKNSDHTISVVEFVESFNANQVSFINPSEQMARTMAGALVQNQIVATALGGVGAIVDKNNDGMVTKQELKHALKRNQVILSGQYLVNSTSHPPTTTPDHPQPPIGEPISTPPNHWNPGETQRAKEHITTIESLTKTRKPNGYYDQSSGIYTHNQADDLITNFLKEQVLPAQYMTASEKIELIQAQIMNKKPNGYYDRDSGSLSHAQAKELIDSVMAQSQPTQYLEKQQAQQHITTIESLTKTRKPNGYYEQSSGIYTHDQADDLITNFLKEQVLPAQYMTASEKIELIQAQIMNKKSNGYYDRDSGSLSHAQAKELIDSVMAQPFVH